MLLADSVGSAAIELQQLEDGASKLLPGVLIIGVHRQGQSDVGVGALHTFGTSWTTRVDNRFMYSATYRAAAAMDSVSMCWSPP